MAFTRRPEGTALSHWYECRVATRTMWHFRHILYSLGIDEHEFRFDLQAYLFRKKPQYNPEKGAISTFYFHIARRYTFERFRKAAVRKDGMAGFQIPAYVTRDHLPDETPVLIEKLLAVLTPRQRRIIRARMKGKDLRTIAKKIGVTYQRVQQIERKAYFYMKIEAMRIASAAKCSAGEFWQVRGVA